MVMTIMTDSDDDNDDDDDKVKDYKHMETRKTKSGFHLDFTVPISLEFHIKSKLFQ